jgi:hypothetical protein
MLHIFCLGALDQARALHTSGMNVLDAGAHESAVQCMMCPAQLSPFGSITMTTSCMLTVNSIEGALRFNRICFILCYMGFVNLPVGRSAMSLLCNTVLARGPRTDFIEVAPEALGQCFEAALKFNAVFSSFGLQPSMPDDAKLSNTRALFVVCFPNGEPRHASIAI